MRKITLLMAMLVALAAMAFAGVASADTAGGSGDGKCQNTNSALPYGDNANHYGVEKNAADGRTSGNAQSAFYRCTIY
jgi:hypothetical protein